MPFLLKTTNWESYLEQAIQSWLVGGWVTEPPDLPSQHPAVLYCFLEYLSRRLLHCQKDWPYLPVPLGGLNTLIIPSVYWSQFLTPDGVFRLLKAAFTGVTNWPNGLFQFLDAYCGAPPLNDEQRLRSFQRDWFQSAWKNSNFEFLQQGYVSYLLARNLPIPVSLASDTKMWRGSSRKPACGQKNEPHRPSAFRLENFTNPYPMVRWLFPMATLS